MKKKILKIAILAISLLLIAGVCVIANAFFGNPVSKALATNTAKKHLAENYADTDFVIDRVSFNFKDTIYHAYISSPHSIDSSFTIMIDMLGRLRYDTYEDRVLSGWNTADRISMAYRAEVERVLQSENFPYDTQIGFGDFEYYPKAHAEQYSVPEYALIMEDLEFDGEYDVNVLGAKHGKLTIYVEDETVSCERLSEILLDIKKSFDDAKVNFFVIDCVLEYPRPEEVARKEGRVEVMEFLYSEIFADGLTERVKASDEAAQAYYAEQDAQGKEAEAK